MTGIVRIDQVVGMYEVWLDESFPFAKMKIKVLKRGDGDFLAVPNLAVRDRISRQPEFMSGLGADPKSAIDDAMEYFMKEVDENRPDRDFAEDDFEWPACEDF
jgi:hypothetical protein